MLFFFTQPAMDSLYLVMFFFILMKFIIVKNNIIMCLLVLEFLMSWALLIYSGVGLMGVFSMPMMFLIFVMAVSEGGFGLSLLISFYRSHTTLKLIFY